MTTLSNNVNNLYKINLYVYDEVEEEVNMPNESIPHTDENDE